MNSWRTAVLATIILCLGATGAVADWESTWKVGDSWTYRVQSLELLGPYTMLPYHTDYTLTLTVVVEEPTDPLGLGLPVWTWTLLVEHDRYGFSVASKETIYVVKGVEVVRWPLPTLFLWFDVNYRPEQGAASVGIRLDGTGPAVWEQRLRLDSAGEGWGEVVNRVTLEPIGSNTVEIAGRLTEVQGLRYRAETKVQLVGGRPRVRVHEGTAWGSPKMKNWVLIVGREEVDGRVVRDYRLELVSFSLASEG